jgi:AraC-like DNA-binding protein
MRVKSRIEARHLFFSGHTLAEVAQAVGVHRSTTERWSREEGWVEQREIRNYELKHKYIKENFQFYYHNVIGVADDVYRVIADGIAERRLLSEGKLARRNLKISNRMLISMAKTYANLEKMICELDSYKMASRNF